MQSILSVETMSSLLFQGSKFFWRTRNNIDVAIVSHVDSKTTEVIAYEPVLDVEAERIYLNSEVLSSVLNQTEIKAMFSFAKQNNVPHTTQFESDVVTRAISDFVLNRLVIKEFSKEENRFTVQLHNVTLNASTNDLLCPKPAELSPYIIKHHKLYSDIEINEAQLALQEAQNNLEEQCNKAIQLQTEVSAQLSSKERWRIPLVLVKLSKNKTLNETHEKIWTAVSSNLKTQEDIDTLTTTALRMVPPLKTPTHRHNSSSRGPHNTRENGSTPNRSPCPTPRAAPHTNATSQRLFSGTVSSQNRAQRIAQEEDPSPRPLLKRANSRGVASTSARKASKRINSKNTLLAATSTDGDVGLSSPQRDGCMNTAESDATTSLMEQVATGVVPLTSVKLDGEGSIHTTDRILATAEGEASAPLGHREAGGASLQVFDKCDAVHLTNPVGKDFDSSVCTPYTNDASVGVASDRALSRDVSYHHAGLSVVHEGSARVKPPKRRSYLGSLLASFIGTTMNESSLQAAGSEGTDANFGAEELLTVRALSHKQAVKKRGGGVTLSAALAAWLPWSQSAPVVPVDLPEYVPVEHTPILGGVSRTQPSI